MSWGTKGVSKITTELGYAYRSGGLNRNEVEVIVPTEEKDINAAYEDAMYTLYTSPPKTKQKVDSKTEQQDFYKTFRTNVSHADLDCQDRG